jgi:hypothetical protein
MMIKEGKKESRRKGTESPGWSWSLSAWKEDGRSKVPRLGHEVAW